MDNSKTLLKITVMTNMVVILLFYDYLLSPIIHRLKPKFTGMTFESFHHPFLTSPLQHRLLWLCPKCSVDIFITLLT